MPTYSDVQGLQHIDHFFVLMLENRSFDHMFGADAGLGLNDPLPVDATCPGDPVKPGSPALPLGFAAPDVADPDPPHEFADVYLQITGKAKGGYTGATSLSMNGFAASGRRGLLQGEGKLSKWRKEEKRADGSYALDCQGLDSIPVLRTLARNFALCENWYSSMPGPTWPNRFFIHAASAGGLTNSPSSLTMGSAVLVDELGFEFENGTIYDRLGDGNWRVYHGDALPQVLAIKGMARTYVGAGADRFRRLSKLHDDLQQAVFAPKYVFIEPNHSIVTDSHWSDSQHPPGRVSAGERLIKQVYDAISQSPHWHASALIIVYDEHGGFYDHCPPPVATPPGDAPLNARKAQFPHDFAFDRLGVRVPAIVVSPWIEPGTVDPDCYDHSSVLKTVERRFGLDPLTGRDRVANDFAHLFARAEPRADIPEVFAESPDMYAVDDVVPPIDGDDDAESSPEDLAAGSLAGFLRIAVTVDHLQREQQATTTQKVLHYLLARRFPSLAITTAPLVATRQEARAYIARVASRFEEPVAVAARARE